jgi:hypothetical protein
MQNYYNNAKTNIHNRLDIQSSELTKTQLASKYQINTKTVSKWNSRNFTSDKSSRPNNIHYSLSEIDKELILSIRKTTWWSAEQIVDSLNGQIDRINKSNVSRLFVVACLNKLPEEEKERHKQFKTLLSTPNDIAFYSALTANPLTWMSVIPNGNYDKLNNTQFQIITETKKHAKWHFVLCNRVLGIHHHHRIAKRTKTFAMGSGH